MMMPRYPVCKEIPWVDPKRAIACLPQKNSVWLDSAQTSLLRGKFSYCAIDPFQKWVLKGGFLNGCAILDKPFAALKREMHAYQLSKIENRPPFQGGVAGFLSYDLAWYYEDLPQQAESSPDFEDWILGFYDLVIAFDHSVQKAWIFSTGFPEQDEDKRLARAHQRATWLEGMLLNPKEVHCLPNSNVAWQRTDDLHSYRDKVYKTIEYIRAGDIFEANMSQRFSMPFELEQLSALYATLRQQNPAPFAAWLQFEETQILSASPERFLQVEGKRVETRPIKGTMARDSDPIRDRQIQESLYASEKDRAENVMIVDLMRNDLSKVCLSSSVKVPQLCDVETFAQVHHLVSCVTGELKANLCAVDALEAAFPGGSITGAPKIRAMEIIEELEPYKRGPYCGSIGYVAFHGDMDTSITIRTFAFKDNTLVCAAGGAVTIDSDPSAEYYESMAKARGLIELLEK